MSSKIVCDTCGCIILISDFVWRPGNGEDYCYPCSPDHIKHPKLPDITKDYPSMVSTENDGSIENSAVSTILLHKVLRRLTLLFHRVGLNQENVDIFDDSWRQLLGLQDVDEGEDDAD